MRRLGQALLSSKLAQVGELLAPFLVAGAVIWGVGPLVGEDPLARYGVVRVANVLMLVTVWLGLHFRGQGWEHYGLSFQVPSRRTVVRAVIQSVVVFVVAGLAFARPCAGQALLEACEPCALPHPQGNGSHRPVAFPRILRYRTSHLSVTPLISSPRGQEQSRHSGAILYTLRLLTHSNR